MCSPGDKVCNCKRPNRASTIPSSLRRDAGSHDPAVASRRHTHGDAAGIPPCLIPGLSQDPLPVHGRKNRVEGARYAHGHSVPTVIQARSANNMKDPDRDLPVPHPLSAAQRRPEPRSTHHIQPPPAAREPKPDDLFLPTAALRQPHNTRHRPRPRPRPAKLYVRHDSDISQAPPSVAMERRRTHQLPVTISKARLECVEYKGQRLLDRMGWFMQRQCQKLLEPKSAVAVEDSA